MTADFTSALPQNIEGGFSCDLLGLTKVRYYYLATVNNICLLV